MPAKKPAPGQFAHYARYYDLLYENKEYQAETEFVHGQLGKMAAPGKDLLELGCGTGRHALAFTALGWKVTGVDLSPGMVQQAQARAKQTPARLRPNFAVGDMTSLRLGRRYDAVVSLFHVMGYQTTNRQLAAACQTAASHLQPGGVFFFDYWFGPAVLTTPPSVRVKRFEDDLLLVTRVSEPRLEPAHNVVNVDIDVLVENKRTHRLDRIKEQHRVRYFFVPELEYMLAAAGLEVIGHGRWMTEQPLDSQSWYGWMAARFPL
jgi:SAM-dependent methyltransferase